MTTSRMLSTPVLLAASISITSMSSPRAMDRHESHLPHGSVVGLSEFLAVQSLGEDAGHRRLARPARAAEQIRVGDPSGLDRLFQRLRNVILPDDFVEVANDNGGPGRCKTCGEM